MNTSAEVPFEIIVFDETDSWNTLLSHTTSHLDRRGLNRLHKVLKESCKCVVIEKHYIDRDYRDTFSYFHSKRFATPNSRCLRLHFFSDTIEADDLYLGDKKVEGIYLGYSVIRPTKPNCVGRTLLSHKIRLDANSHISICEETVHLMGTPLKVEGFPFISQDTDSTVCAQSALWMLMRYYSNKYSPYSEILPFQITSLANQHASGTRVYPSSGLYSWQLAEALRLQRFSPITYSRRCFKDNFDHLLYTYIESGLPLLATLSDHVIVAYGHRSNYALHPPCGSLITTVAKTIFRKRDKYNNVFYTSHFNQSLVVSDDNCFPYQALNEDRLISEKNSKYKWNDVEEFIVPLPEKVFLTAEQAQVAIEAILYGDDVGGISCSKDLSSREHLVLRLFLTTSRSFKCSLRKRGMGNERVEEMYKVLPMPHFIWVCEIADYSEYVNTKKVLGEIIWDATRNAHEPKGWIACHLPEYLIIDTGSAFNKDQDFKKIDLKTKKSYCLFNSNLHSL